MIAMLAAHARGKLADVVSLREIASVCVRAMSLLDKRPRSCLGLIRKTVDHQHCRPTLRERARNDFPDLPLAADAGE
jgi:hypothetical protein